MDIVEGLSAWQQAFADGWLAHYQETGKIDWKRYTRPRNRTVPGTPGIDLTTSRLMLISSSGAYLRAHQEPFDAENDLGDYSIRAIPTSSSFEEIAYAHTHYDHAAVDADPQVLVPLEHLRELDRAGLIGELAPSFVSFGGYQPDAGRVVAETIPAVLEIARKERIHAALLVPA